MTVDEQIKAAYKKKVEGSLEKAVRIYALQAYTNIVISTPVGNPDLWKSDPPPGYVGGRARANWNIDINTVDLSVTESTDAPDTVQAINVTAKYKVKDTIYISNNLPYIQRLNEGWSSQAPENFVDKGLMLASRQAKQIIARELK
ncbi:hypothetical protein [Dyadobacter jiangsuensis]|uniref:Neck protein n=1 Tax=Dyadobacter jiangsuensis TaxID=1591085 RepID=A0A2P8FP24_9BACT|nr:hypothetical protein [Dyadobacter jiangsuensis]PSL23474.1 hypothetical protein CLV60_11629 [Dyadobacter jiangsuensis]